MIQHDHICTPGFVGERFTERGYDFVLHQVVSEDDFQSPNVETQFPKPTDFDVIISMGAPWSVYDHETIGSWVLPELAMLLLMTVEPGFGGQKFLDLVLPKIRRARDLVRKHGLETWLQVDGGVSLETIERCAEAGADVFVAGSAVYSADDPDAMVAELRAKAAAVSS